jgi:hypothetical protein
MAVVYAHYKKTNNEIFYIGIGDNISRAYEWGRNKHWCNIVKKYDYEIEILIENITWELACEYEMYLIRFYGRHDKKLGPLVNLTDGGDGVLGLRHTEEYKERLKTSGPMSNLEVVAKWKDSINNRTQQQKENTRSKILNSTFGKYTEEELKERYEKIANTMKGIKRPNTSKKMKGQSKQKIKCPHCEIESQASLAYRWHFDNCKNKIYE